ncbi:hypothetical protein HWV62_6447 [Athelia sp. TMB]|nr:hypothetical protein HWV62_6447 [Athelia sp. TMB]
MATNATSPTSPGYLGLESTFESVGVRAPIASALREAFPNVRKPTKAQSQFIPAVLSGKDVLLKDGTGTGKSFGVILALLSKARKATILTNKGIQPVKPFITSLVIVPHRDLAFQFHHWIERIVSASGTTPPPLATISAVVVRGGGVSVAEQRPNIMNHPPHILIGTPQALLELFDDDETITRSKLKRISTIYVDEVDYLIESVPNHSTARTQEKIKRRMDRHPEPTSQLLDLILSERKSRWDGRASPQDTQADGPQLVMSSATLRSHLQRRLAGGGGWIKRDSLVQVTGEGQSTSGVANAKGISHSVLVVSKDGQIRNIEGAVEATTSLIDTKDMREVTADEVFSSRDTDLVVDTLEDKYAKTELKINRDALETVAAAFALDVPSLALLSLPAQAPVQRIVHELRELGVNAHSLDLLVADKGRIQLLQGAGASTEDNPLLLVSTLASTRGLDLPDMTHVFMLGLPRGRRADAYLHVAGRVGRFGKAGKVVTVLEEREEERRADGTLAWARDEPKRMLMLLREIGVAPTQFEHFD